MRRDSAALATRSRVLVMSNFWAVATLLAFGWLLRIPSEPEATLSLGFSPLRLLLAGGVLAIILVFIGLGKMEATNG